MDDISKINKQFEAAVAALGQFALSTEAARAAISSLQTAITATNATDPVAQPKLPEGYNPHKPGDPCPIGPSTWCAVCWPDGSNSEQPGMYCAHAPAKEQDWNLISGYKIVPNPETPKLPDGYIAHKPGDPCPINPETPCQVAFRDGTSSDEYCSSNPIKAGQWNWRDDDNDRDIIGYKIVPSPEQPKEEPKPEWPWYPDLWEEYFSINLRGGSHKFANHDDEICQYAGQTARIYKTEQEAIARAELDKRLAMTARLRQLGGGDEGWFVVRWDDETEEWLVWGARLFAPGEARFLDRPTAEAAIKTLRAANLLPESWQ